MYPVSAILADDEVMGVFHPGDHGSTFGGNPLVSRTACMVLDIMREEGLAERAGRIGGGMLEAFRQRLAANGNVREVRGRGLMIGIELKRDANQLKQAALERGLFLNVTQDRVIRLLPPLIIDDEQAAEIVDTVCSLVDGMGG